MAVGISRSIGIGMKKCCGGGIINPPSPPNSCPLVLDGTGDSLTWADPRATAIAPFTMSYSMDFWFTNKEPVAKSFTILSLGKEISGQFYDTVELKYDNAANKLVIELKGDLANSPTTALAEFELHSAQNSSISGLTSVNDKWIKCAGNCNLNGGVHLTFSIPGVDAVTNVLDASNISLWWNGQLLTASFTESSFWDVNSSYYINFLTLGDYRGASTAATASAVNGEFFRFVWRNPPLPPSSTLPSFLYNHGYPGTTLYLQSYYAFALSAQLPSGSGSGSEVLSTIAPNDDLPATFNADAVIICGPVPYYCAPTPPPATFTFRVKSTDYHPLPANCDKWTMSVTLNGTLVCEVVKDSSAVATVTNPSFQVVATDVIEATVTALAPTGSCASQYGSTEVFMQTGYGNSNVIPYTTRLNFTSPGTQSYSFSPVENVDDTINIYGTPIV
jgi:hypothetical protein